MNSMKTLMVFNLLVLLLIGCSEGKSSDDKKIENKSADNSNAKNTTVSNKIETATFAGGCFWCMEAPFEGIDGVISVISGYAGGNEKDPTYSDVSNGRTGHRESIQIKYDPEIISYSELLDIYWQQFNPTDLGGSFHDRAMQYDPAIFYANDLEKQTAEKSKERLNNSAYLKNGCYKNFKILNLFILLKIIIKIITEKIRKQYHAYKKGSGREDFIKDTWGVIDNGKYKKPKDEVLKKKLNELEYYVTQKNGTEKPFENKYNDNHKEGIYVDIVLGEPLFSSKDKFKLAPAGQVLLNRLIPDI